MSNKQSNKQSNKTTAPVGVTPAVPIPDDMPIYGYSVTRGAPATKYAAAIPAGVKWSTGDAVALLAKSGKVKFAILGENIGTTQAGHARVSYTSNRAMMTADIYAANKVADAASKAAYWESDRGKQTAANIAARAERKASEVVTRVDPDAVAAAMGPNTTAAAAKQTPAATGDVASNGHPRCHVCNRGRKQVEPYPAAGVTQACKQCRGLSVDVATARAAAVSAKRGDAAPTAERAPVAPAAPAADDDAVSLAAVIAELKATGASAATIAATITAMS